MFKVTNPIPMADLARELSNLATGMKDKDEQESIRVQNKDGETYEFQKFSDGWYVTNKDTNQILIAGLDDDEMLAHFKLLRG